MYFIFCIIKQLCIICLILPLILSNKLLSGKLSNIIKYFMTQGGPLFIKTLQWITQKEELSFLLCLNSIKDIQYYCNLKNEKYAKDTLQKYDKNIKIISYLGSGSIAQVYKCSFENKIVAVKILHKNIYNIMKANIFIAKIFTRFSQKFNLVPLLKSYDIDTILSEHMRQCDLQSEAQNTIFLKNKNNINEINFVEIYSCNKNIIVEEYFEGYKFDEFIKIYPQFTILAKRIQMTAFLNMLFCFDIIYGDCHDGNILFNVIDDQVHAYFIDCGIYHTITDEFKDILYKMFIGYNTKNADLQISLYEKYNDINEIDKMELKKLLLNAMNENRRSNNFSVYIKKIIEINRKYKLCGHYLFDILCVNILLILGSHNNILFDTVKFVLKERKYTELCKKLEQYKFN